MNPNQLYRIAQPGSSISNTATGEVSGAQLSVTTVPAAATGTVALRFIVPGSAQAHVVQALKAQGAGQHTMNLPGHSTQEGPPLKRQRTEQGALPHPLMQQGMQQGMQPQPYIPAAVPSSNLFVDDMKSLVHGHFAHAQEAILTGGLSPQQRMQQLQNFRLICHELINRCWQALRLDLAIEVATKGEVHYNNVARATAMLGNLSYEPFYLNFTPNGLHGMNESLGRVPLPGYALQFNLHIPSQDGPVRSPMLPIFRLPEPPAMREKNRHTVPTAAPVNPKAKQSHKPVQMPPQMLHQLPPQMPPSLPADIPIEPLFETLDDNSDAEVF